MKKHAKETHQEINIFQLEHITCESFYAVCYQTEDVHGDTKRKFMSATFHLCDGK